MAYDQQDVRDCAARLNGLVANVIFGSCVAGVLAGAVVGGIVGNMAGVGTAIPALVGGGLGGWGGYEAGMTRALSLRLQRLTALWQLEMYQIARRPAAGASTNIAVDVSSAQNTRANVPEQAASPADDAAEREQWMRKVREQQGRCVLCGFEMSNSERMRGKQHKKCVIFKETQADIMRYRDAKAS